MTVVPLRTFTIGGSDAAAAAGIDPHKSRMKLWLEKQGVIEVEETEAMRWGTVLQPAIVDELRRQGIEASEGRDLAEMPNRRLSGEVVDDARPWLVGHPDGLIYDDDGLALLEIKTVGQWAKREWNGEPPVAYVAQIQHYLHLTGFERALLAVLVGGQKLELTEIERNDRQIERLLEREEEFHGYLVRGDRPPVRHDDAAALLAEFPSSTPMRVRLTGEPWRVLRDLRARREQMAAIKRQIEGLENRLKEELGDAEAAVSPYDEIVLRWRSHEQHRFDVTRFREDHPRMAAKYEKTIPVRRFEVL